VPADSARTRLWTCHVRVKITSLTLNSYSRASIQQSSLVKKDNTRDTDCTRPVGFGLNDLAYFRNEQHESEAHSTPYALASCNEDTEATPDAFAEANQRVLWISLPTSWVRVNKKRSLRDYAVLHVAFEAHPSYDHLCGVKPDLAPESPSSINHSASDRRGFDVEVGNPMNV
jgi:hypothetical protein